MLNPYVKSYYSLLTIKMNNKVVWSTNMSTIIESTISSVFILKFLSSIYFKRKIIY